MVHEEGTEEMDSEEQDRRLKDDDRISALGEDVSCKQRREKKGAGMTRNGSDPPVWNYAFLTAFFAGAAFFAAAFFAGAAFFGAAFFTAAFLRSGFLRCFFVVAMFVILPAPSL